MRFVRGLSARIRAVYTVRVGLEFSPEGYCAAIWFTKNNLHFLEIKHD